MVQKFTKMKEEYVIINKSVLEKRIEELDKELLYHTEWYKKAKERYHEERKSWGQADDGEMRVASDAASTTAQEMKILKQVLSQSTPLIPEIEKHSIEFTKTLLSCTVSEAKSIDNIKEYHPKEYQLLLGELELNGKKIFEDYISNLKLDI